MFRMIRFLYMNEPDPKLFICLFIVIIIIIIIIIIDYYFEGGRGGGGIDITNSDLQVRDNLVPW